MNQLRNIIRTFVEDQEGATVVEYGVLIALIIAALVVIIGVLGERITNGFKMFIDRMVAEGM
jgi:Flp pilus assembly pilin Flp